MNILVFSTLYPNRIQRRHGIFVQTRLRHLTATGQVNASVVAPVPWFPFRAKCFGSYSDFAKVPKVEHKFGITAYHPRYQVIPKIGMNYAPASLYKAGKQAIQKLLDRGQKFDLIDAHYFYPDGVAAARLGEHFGLPVVITARGTDINLIPQYAKPKVMIAEAISKASGVITVCEALRQSILQQFTVSPNDIVTLRNGVDLELFQPGNHESQRQALGFKGNVLLSVGHLIERKGHHLVIEALAGLDSSFSLYLIGDGPEEKNLRDLVEKLNLQDRVTFVGPLTQPDLAKYYSAADALVLASSREGWANVLLESMACGTPVVATNVWGAPEIVQSSDAGVLARERSSESLISSIKTLFAATPQRSNTRTYAEQFSWDATTQGQLNLFSSVLQARAAA